MQTLEEVCKGAGWVAHSFVLMKNHYHLLIETLRPTLVKGMQYLNSTCTGGITCGTRSSGICFEGDYKVAQKLGLQTRGGMSHGITQIARRLDEDGKLKKKWKMLLISQNVA